MRKRFLALGMSAVMAISTVITAGAETVDNLSIGEPFSANTGDEDVAGNFDITYTFHNASQDTTWNWNNFIFEIFDGNGQFITLRADAFGWTAGKWTLTDGIGDDNRPPFTGLPEDWAKWAADMSDADVIVNAQRKDSVFAVQYEITGASGAIYKIATSMTVKGDVADDLKVHITGEKVDLSDIKFTQNEKIEQPDPDEEQTDTDAEQTDTDAEQTDTDAEQTDTDAEQTDTDAEQTDTDAEQTDTDAEQTDTDAEQTDTDAEQTDTDAEQTDTDAEQTDTDAEQTATDVLPSESGDDIQIEYNKDQFEGTVKLNTKQLDVEDEAYKQIDLKKFVTDTTNTPETIPFVAYDITLTDEDNQAVQPNGKVAVKIACPEEFDGSKCKVYRVNTNGSLTNMKASYGDGYLRFETNHFSTYVITESDLFAGEGFVYGDVNGDGEVDSKDAVLLKKYLAGFEDAIERLDQNAGDVTGDGDVTSADAVRLLKALAEYDVELGR